MVDPVFPREGIKRIDHSKPLQNGGVLVQSFSKQMTSNTILHEEYYLSFVHISNQSSAGRDLE